MEKIKNPNLALSRRKALLGLAAMPLASSCANFNPLRTKSGPPNILFIMADDLGYADLSCFGRRDYETPEIDKLAREGIRLTSAYSNSPVCSATRTALMSGQYQYRLPVGLEEPLVGNRAGYPADRTSLPKVLKAAGYQTALIGKWHIGHLPEHGPLQSGYDHFWGFRDGGIDYFNHDMAGRADLWDGDIPVEETGYLTDLIGERTIKQIEDFAGNNKPFLVSLHFSAPHWPWEGPDDVLESERLSQYPSPRALAHFDGGTLKTYAEMVIRLDHQVGRVLNALDRLGLSHSTVVVFTSDNGGERFSDNWPFSGKKSELLEGGIRVPTIVRWPGRVTRGGETDVPVMTMDWLPTLVSIAQAEVPENYEADGVDVTSVLFGADLKERELFWRFKLHNQKSVRLGRWKYLSIAGHEFLFDIAADPLERANLKSRRPDVFNELKASYEAWNAEMLPYTDSSISIGLSGREFPERYGVHPSESVAGNLRSVR